MTFTKETWLGMAGIATLLAYFFWPKKASASTVSTSPTKKPSGTYTAPKKPTGSTTSSPPPYGTPDGPAPTDTTPADATPDAEADDEPKSMGKSGMTDKPFDPFDEFGDTFIAGVGTRVGHNAHNQPAGRFGNRSRELGHGVPSEWWTMMRPRVTGADFGMWTPPARTAGPHVFQGKDYNPTSVWPTPPPMFAQIPGFSDYDLGFDYGKASCLGLAALMMRPTAPSDDWLTGYDAGCAAARSRTH